MPKTYEEIQKETQERIDKAINRKETRQSKTEISIGFRWAVNVAVAFLPEKLRGTTKGFKQMEKWLEKFQDLDRNFMIENMPIDVEKQIKLNAKDFAIAQKNAPESEAKQALADEVGGKNAMEEANKRSDEMTTTEIPEEIPIIQKNE